MNRRKRQKEEEAVKAFLKSREVKEGNDIIKRYVAGDASGRTKWIWYFYTECTDKKVIRENCKKLFGGRDEDDAVGYVGAYTMLRELSKYSSQYKAGFNYSFEQMEANYD